jgi:S-DNA-T family DNA segregation ATPase FtsK/SpoIIIE
LVACTQKPAASVIGSLVKSNFPVRLVGSVTSPEDAKVATGLAGTGAERLMGAGDFLVVAKGQTTRMQAAYIEIEKIRELVAHLREGNHASRNLLAPTVTHGRNGSPTGLASRLRSKLHPLK